VANVSYLRTPSGGQARVYRSGGIGLSRRPGGIGSSRRRRRWPWLVGGTLLAVLLALAAAAFLVSTSKPTLTGDASALAKVTLPLGGGTVSDVSATTGVQNRMRFLKVHLTGDPVLVPTQKIASGEKVTVSVVVHRPSWIAWLTGKSQRLTKTITTPTTRLRSRYITLTKSGALRVRFSAPVRTIAYGPSAKRLTTHALSHPQRSVTLAHRGSAGTLYLAAAAQKWETAKTWAVNWFPAGTKATAVAQPRAGGTIHSNTPITLSFSKPVSQVLGSHMPTVSPSGAGSWHTVSSHEIRYVPTGYGYGMGAKVTVALPAVVRLAGASEKGSASTGTWSVPEGSTVRLQQVLAQLGYLPFTVHYTGAQPADTISAQEVAAEAPPAATLSWEYGNTPSGLKAEWGGVSHASVLTQGALMKFQYDHNLSVTGYEDAETWNALFQAIVKHERNTFGYTFVSVSEGSPESLFVWHSGKTVLSNIPVNTGIPAAPTATGTYPVFEHIPVTTMSGTNPDGSHYHDPGIKWVSYFHGGDALHEFPRASYGYPQSLGCVEMDDANAYSVYQYTPIGTLVQVNG
jgi:peptidoglycan hydrolase-like protein with peptidoglycan-binding domain